MIHPRATPRAREARPVAQPAHRLLYGPEHAPTTWSRGGSQPRTSSPGSLVFPPRHETQRTGRASNPHAFTAAEPKAVDARDDDERSRTSPRANAQDGSDRGSFAHADGSSVGHGPSILDLAEIVATSVGALPDAEREQIAEMLARALGATRRRRRA